MSPEQEAIERGREYASKPCRMDADGCVCIIIAVVCFFAFVAMAILAIHNIFQFLIK